MAKKRTKLHIRIPHYHPPRLSWRMALYTTIAAEAKRKNVRYDETDALQLEIRLYLDGNALVSHDVDNRLKDIMDALQGRIGGSKKVHAYTPIIPNDRQIYRVLIEKSAPPGQSHGSGHLIIRRYKA